MKKKRFIKSIGGTLLVALSLFAVSCSDNDIEPGNSQVMAINAAQGSNDQDFYVANNRLASAISYGSNSNYVTANAGNNLVVRFTNSGTETVYKEDRFDFSSDHHYSIILAGNGEQARIIKADDDLNAPSSGRVKVRFVPVSDVMANQTVYISNGNGDVVANNVAYNSVSAFVEIDPSIQVLRVAPVGSTEYANLSLSAFLEGKIYTVIISGSGDIQTRTITHN